MACQIYFLKGSSDWGMKKRVKEETGYNQGNQTLLNSKEHCWYLKQRGGGGGSRGKKMSVELARYNWKYLLMFRSVPEKEELRLSLTDLACTLNKN